MPSKQLEGVRQKVVLSIGSNTSSLIAQRSLSRATERLSNNLERLSSGMRINRAADDAAGLSIADQLRSDARLFGKALQNINDAVSAVSIIDAALGNQTSILTRLSELSEQAANGTYSGTQRLSLNKEYIQLLQEYGRIASTTSFNGLKLLQGGRGLNPTQMQIQAGIDGAAASLLQLIAPDTGSFTGVVKLADWYGFYSPIPQTLDTITSHFDGNLGTTSVVDSQGRQHTLIFGLGRSEDTPENVELTVFELESGISQAGSTYTVLAKGNLLVDAQGNFLEHPNWNLTFSGGATARFTADFSELRVSQDAGQYTGVPNLGSSTAIDFTSVVDQRTARNALTLITNNLVSIESLRGRFGALESRLQTAKNVVFQSRETTLGAESRIRDVDVAAEAASLVSSSILQQVASSVLAQANQAPSLALRLLSNIK